MTNGQTKILNAARKLSKNGEINLDDLTKEVGGTKNAVGVQITTMRKQGIWPYTTVSSNGFKTNKEYSPRPRETVDHELKVINSIVNMMLTLSEESQTRVWTYIKARFENE